MTRILISQNNDENNKPKDEGINIFKKLIETKNINIKDNIMPIDDKNKEKIIKNEIQKKEFLIQI